MKKFFAVFLLMVYGFTSVNASVAIHQCSDNAGAAAHHHSTGASQERPTSDCPHQQLHATANCCTTAADVCAAKTENSTAEAAVYKQVSSQPLFFQASDYEGQARPFSAATTFAPPLVASSSSPKIRLHLYNRLLLI